MKHGGDASEDEIAITADVVAGMLAIVFRGRAARPAFEKRELFERVRPTGTLRAARDVMMYVLHKRFDLPQPRLAAALGRDRGTVSGAATRTTDAADRDFDIAWSLREIGEMIDGMLELGDGWAAALETLGCDEKLARIEAEIAADAIEADEEDRAAAAPPPRPGRCHECKGVRAVRVHRNGSDPAYRPAWAACEAVAPDKGGFHKLPCKACQAPALASLGAPAIAAGMKRPPAQRAGAN